MGKVDIKEELAVQAAVTENTEQDGNVRLTKSMSIQDMVKVMMPEIKKALPSVITPERFTRIALSALNNTPALKQCSPILDLPTSLIEVPEGQEWILDMITNILVEVLSSIAEQERLTIRRRQREGINAANAKGKHLGRPRMEIPGEFPEVYEQWKKGEITAVWAMKKLGMKRTSFYKQVKKYESCIHKD